MYSIGAGANTNMAHPAIINPRSTNPGAQGG